MTATAPLLVSRLLGPADEPMLRAFWAHAPHAHLFAIPDLDFLGWAEGPLRFTGWFAGGALVAYLMEYGVSAQWAFEDARVVPALAVRLSATRPHFVTGLEALCWPVLERLPPGTVGRAEPSTIARLQAAHFNRATLRLSQGCARQGTLADLEPLTATHVAAPDQFNQFDYPTRRRALRAVLSDGWRRLFLAETAAGEVVASAQSSAEGHAMAVIGGVVTHPAFRGQGYATAATAHLCAALLADGKQPYLFYRRDNVAAARVYQKIGFEPLDDGLLAELRWS